MDTNLNDATHIKWLKTRKENKNGKQYFYTHDE